MHVESSPHDGAGFEREFCGCAFSDVSPKFRRHRVRNVRKAIRRVRMYQCLLGWDPRRPKTELACSLFRRITSRLPNGKKELRLYIAVGTCLDLLGIDCFFEYRGRIVTVDLTTSVFKKDCRADILLTRWHFLKNEHYNIGSHIASRLGR